MYVTPSCSSSTQHHVIEYRSYKPLNNHVLFKRKPRVQAIVQNLPGPRIEDIANPNTKL